MTKVEFSKYTVVVYNAFLNISSSHFGSSAFTVTKKDSKTHGGLKSLAINELSKQMFERFEMLSAVSHRVYFHPTVEDLWLGRVQRSENIV